MKVYNENSSLLVRAGNNVLKTKKIGIRNRLLSNVLPIACLKLAGKGDTE